MKVPRFCIQKSITSKEATPCSVAELKKVMSSARVQHICDQIKLLDGKDPEELARLKRKLPCITPHAQRFKDNHRAAADAIPSGLVMLDVDHVEDPKAFWSNNPAEGTVLVHITPSGHGLRIIAERKQGESIEAAQQRLAKQYGITVFDIAPKDLSRASYLVPMSYVLYMDEEGLEFFSEEEAKSAAKTFKDVLALPPATHHACPPTVETECIQSLKRDIIHNVSTDGEFPSNYKGIPYKDIVEQLMTIMGGAPVQGERNTFYYSLVRYMRYICDFNEAILLQVLPDFGLPLEERRGEVTRAVATARRSSIPDQLTRAIALAEAASEKAEQEDKRLSLPEPPLPTVLPKVLDTICKSIPEPFRPAMVIASLPILGALATEVRFDYLDHQQHSFSFFSMITGPAATGKSFIRQPVNLLLTPIDEQDDIERAKAEEYKMALRASKNKKDQPEAPAPAREITVSISRLPSCCN